MFEKKSKKLLVGRARMKLEYLGEFFERGRATETESYFTNSKRS